MLRILKNLKTQQTILIALLPLAVMVVIAAAYASVQMKLIDGRYAALLDREVRAEQALNSARSMTRQFALILYRNIAEVDLDRIRISEADLDAASEDFSSFVEEASGETPDRAAAIRDATAKFASAQADARVVRAAALQRDRNKALRSMRGVENELNEARQAISDQIAALAHSVAERSEDLTANTKRTIVVTWIVVLGGLATSVAIALYFAHRQIVAVLLALRDSIRDVAEGHLDRRIPYQNRKNEAGEISRALSTLQQVAAEQALQAWIKTQIAGLVERLRPVDTYDAFGSAMLAGFRKRSISCSERSTSSARAVPRSYATAASGSRRTGRSMPFPSAPVTSVKLHWPGAP